MRDLNSFRQRVQERIHRGTPYDGRKPTQGDLADAVGLSHAEFSKRLNQTGGKRLSPQDVRAIVRVLVEWGAIGTQAEALELLDLMECPPFTAAEWQAPPFDTLTPLAAVTAEAAVPLLRAGKPQHNLPAPLTSFVGREQEVTRAEELLAQARLLTLTGPGGAGKTRLALQVAARVTGCFGDGVWLVELAGLRGEGLVAGAVASTLSIREQAGQELSAALVHHFKSRAALLVLDNCEHLTNEVANLVYQLLSACPNLRVLATSRETLRVQGEVNYRVPAMSLPDAQVAASHELIMASSAVRLFVERAQTVLPDFRLTNSNAQVVGEICVELDGIPLAIELAAARLRTMDVTEIRCRLGDRFHLLVGGSRTADFRQQTLRAACDWSYELLTPDEQRLFRRLSVFASGFQLAAAEKVCIGDGIREQDVTELLSQLVDKSLVLMEEQAGAGHLTVRYFLLETLRQYGAQHLRGDERETLHTRHLEWYLALAEREAASLNGIHQAEALDQLEIEHNNLRQALWWALSWWVGMGGDYGVRLGAALWRFWRVRGYISEGRRWLEAIIAQSRGSSPARADVFAGAGTLAHMQGDYEVARECHQQSLALGRELENKLIVATALRGLGTVLISTGDYRGALSLYEDSLALMRAVGDRDGIAGTLNNAAIAASELGELAQAATRFAESLEIRRQMSDWRGAAIALSNLGKIALIKGNYQDGRKLSEESLAIDRGLGNKQGMATSLATLGEIAWEQGDYVAARAYHLEYLTLCQELGNRQGIAFALEGLADVAAATGLAAGAARLHGAAEALRDALGTPVQPSDRAEYERKVAICRAQLDEQVFACAWAEGRTMDVEEAIGYAILQVG